MLKEIGKSTYSILYSFDGSLPFNLPKIQDLKWGDAISDCGGKGIRMVVNECYKCGEKYLCSRIIFVPDRGPCCPETFEYGW